MVRIVSARHALFDHRHSVRLRALCLMARDCVTEVPQTQLTGYLGHGLRLPELLLRDSALVGEVLTEHRDLRPRHERVIDREGLQSPSVAVPHSSLIVVAQADNDVPGHRIATASELPANHAVRVVTGTVEAGDNHLIRRIGIDGHLSETVAGNLDHTIAVLAKWNRLPLPRHHAQPDDR